jgi:hypothetical protein
MLIYVKKCRKEASPTPPKEGLFIRAKTDNGKLGELSLLRFN